MYIYTCIYVYIYIYIYTCIYNLQLSAKVCNISISQVGIRASVLHSAASVNVGRHPPPAATAPLDITVPPCCLLPVSIVVSCCQIFLWLMFVANSQLDVIFLCH